MSWENSTCDFLFHLVAQILLCTLWLMSTKVQLTSALLKGHILFWGSMIFRDNYSWKLFTYTIVMLTKNLILFLKRSNSFVIAAGGEHHHRVSTFNFCNVPLYKEVFKRATVFIIIHNCFEVQHDQYTWKPRSSQQIGTSSTCSLLRKRPLIRILKLKGVTESCTSSIKC